MTKIYCDVWECKYNRQYPNRESECSSKIVHFGRFGRCKAKPDGKCRGKKPKYRPKCVSWCESVDFSSEGNPNTKE